MKTLTFIRRVSVSAAITIEAWTDSPFLVPQDLRPPNKHGCSISVLYLMVFYCGRVPAANAPGYTAAEGLLYKPWSLVVPTCTVRCLHQRP